MQRISAPVSEQPPEGATLDRRFEFCVGPDGRAFWSEEVGTDLYWYEGTGTIGRALTALWHASQVEIDFE